ncbi:uncharacterized protein LOC111085413 [Limulus polyphemus]|uniref:Uncharacterized protein LOC111085413 n=1 Tax=Limulus polyphemus TaxID=6850 RepID=A0ABM1S7E4_LIMPO|nr:uncharacterized protein LOC111085413 [Limulus polyphemus]
MGSILRVLISVLWFPIEFLYWFRKDGISVLNKRRSKSVFLRIKQLVVFLYLLLKRNFLKRRLVNITTDYRQGAIKFGVIAAEEERNLENPRHLKNTDDFDEIFFCGVNSVGDAIVLRITRRGTPQEGVQLHLKHAQKNELYQLPLHPDTNVVKREKDVFVAAGIRIKCLNPLRNWRISYNGLLRKVSPIGDRVQQEDVHVKFSFVWAVTTLPFDFKIDFCPRLLSEAVATGTWTRRFPTYERITETQDRYDQWGQFRGTVSFDDEEEREMLLWGIKTRQSGSMDRTRYDRYMHIYGIMKDGMSFNISLVPLPGFYTHLHCGYIALPNHYIYPLQDCDLSLPPDGQFRREWTIKCVTDVDLSGTAVIPEVLDLTDSLCMSSEVAGGKGMSLACLLELASETGQFHVPNGIVLTTAAYQRHLTEHPRLEQALSTVRKAISAVDEFLNTPLTEKLKEEVSRALNRVFSKDRAELRFAVRSSDVGEDSSETSAAGQMETILGVKGVSQIHEAVSRCWASSVAFNAVQYRRQNGQLVDPNMAVVIQEMVPSQVAGVMFTSHPITGHPSYISISANYGLGEVTRDI